VPINSHQKNINMYKLLLIFLLAALSFAPNAMGATGVKDSVKKTSIKHIQFIKTDSSKIQIRSFNAAALDKYNKAPEFNYQTELSKDASLWERFWRWFWELMERIFGGEKSGSVNPSAFVKYLLLAVVVAALLYGIIKFIGVDRIFNRESQKIDIPYGESLANIHEITFDEEIERAINQRNYRLAVRLLYLRSLKQLSDAGLIHWQIEKTNSAYLSELNNDEYRSSFTVLTRQFEYVWYGDFPIDGSSFQNLNTLFVDFKNMLS
jgi:hypothetical protein